MKMKWLPNIAPILFPFWWAVLLCYSIVDFVFVTIPLAIFGMIKRLLTARENGEEEEGTKTDKKDVANK